MGDRDDLEERIARIKDWPSPRTYSEVAIALGMMNAYRDNIWNFAKHIKPFVDLIKGKGTRSFKWGGDHEGAFLELKNMIVLMLRRHMKDEPEERASGEKQPEKVRNREVEIKIDLDDDYSDGEQQPYQVKYDKMLAVKGKPERPRPPKEPIPMPDEQNYRVVPKLNKSETVKKVAKRILGGNFEMSAEEMATVSPEVARELKAQITKSRQPLDKGTVLAQNVENILPGDCLEEEETLRYDALDINELPKVSIFTLSSGDFINVPAGSLIAPDPYEIYLSTLGSNEEKKQVFMALNQLKSFGIDSGPIKCLFPLVNGIEHVEAILDGGSMIISINQNIAEKLKIPWDPDTAIWMESANGGMKKTSGLARNIPFTLGDLTVYLQAHVIEGVPYDILLGRPFEMLTESIVENKSDGRTFVTLKDPITGKRVAVPTYDRGLVRAKSPRASITEVEDEGEVPNTTAKAAPIKTPPYDQRQDFRTSSRN